MTDITARVLRRRKRDRRLEDVQARRVRRERRLERSASRGRGSDADPSSASRIGTSDLIGWSDASSSSEDDFSDNK